MSFDHKQMFRRELQIKYTQLLFVMFDFLYISSQGLSMLTDIALVLIHFLGWFRQIAQSHLHCRSSSFAEIY